MVDLEANNGDICQSAHFIILYPYIRKDVFIAKMNGVFMV